MRLSLGKIVLLLALLPMIVLAKEPYQWSLVSNKSSVYVNEAIEVEYTCQFEDRAFLYVIEFTPQDQKNSAYRILSLGVKEHVEDGKRSATYRYVLFPKVAGKQHYEFHALMRKTTQASIENSAIGRDNVEDYAFSDEKVILPAVDVDVKPHQERMTGKFSLKVSVDKREVKAYEPVHLDLHMKGEGDFDQMRDINLSIPGVKVFSEKGEHHYRLTKDGFKGEWEQKFSLVGDKDFTIEPITIAYFDIVQKKRIVLRSEQYDIKVKPAYTKEELLDAEEESDAFSWWSWSYLNYVMTFILGVLVHFYFNRWYVSRLNRDKEIGQRDISECRSTKQLLTKLVMLDDRRLDAFINKFDGMTDTASLKALKKEALAILMQDERDVSHMNRAFKDS